MGSIFQRGKRGIWYYQYYVKGKECKKSLKTTDKATAKRLKTIYDAKIETANMGLAPKRFPIQEAFEKFIERKKPFLKPSTLVRYQEEIGSLLEFFTKEKLTHIHQISIDVVTRYIMKRQESGRANKTIQDEIVVLNGVIKMLFNEGLINELPVRKWPTIKIIPKRPDTLKSYSREDIAALAKHFEGTEFFDLFVFLVFTGCRRSECREVRVRDVKDGVLCIRNLKTETSPDNQFRYLEIHPQLKPHC